MLRAVLIGTSGHYGFALNAIKSGTDCSITAYSTGIAGADGSAFAEKMGYKYYESYKKMLDETKPDIAIVNPEFRYISECAAECIKRGVNVFCEKPLSITWQGVENIESSLKNNNVRICAMMGMRYEAAFLSLKKLMESGTLGEIRLIHAQKSYKLGARDEFFKQRKTYGGTIPWVGSHPIDMIYWLTGRKRYKTISALHSAEANSNHGDLETSAAILIQMEDGIIASINIDYLRPQSSTTHGDDRVRIMGSKNWAEIYGGNLYIGGAEAELLENANVFAAFCDELQGKGTCSITNEDSLYITKVCLHARDAADNGKIIDIEETE